MLHLFVEQTVNGIVTGNIYGLIAVGLALVFGVAGIVNFAHGSVFMSGAYIGWLCIATLRLPLVPGLLVAMAACALLGAAIEFLIVRKTLGSSQMAPLLATLGASYIIDQGARLVFGPYTQPFKTDLPKLQLSLFGATVGSIDLIVAGVSLTAALALWLVLRFTGIGRAIRATAQDRDAARQMGVRVGRVNLVTFAVASALGGLAGALIGIYFNSVYPTMGFNAMMKGLVAELLGGMASMPGAIVGGLALGIIESWGVALFGSSYRDLFAFVLLILMLLFRPQGLLGGKRIPRFEPMTGTLPSLAKPVKPPRILAALLVAAAFLLPLASANPYILQILVNAWVYGLLALSLSLFTGTTGQMSMGHAGFLAIGGYASALLSLRLGIPVWASIPIAGIIAAVIGTLIVYPAFRLRGHYLAIATLGVGGIVRLVILNWGSLTNGAMGITNIPPLSIAGFDFVDVRALYWASLAMLVAVAFLQTRLVDSPVGRALRAIRDDETAATSFGVALGRYKAIALAFSGFAAGIAGAFTAHMYAYINHETFGDQVSILGLTMVILGGLGNVWGAVAGSVLLLGLPELFRGFADVRYLVYGLALVLIVRFRPSGIMGID